MSKLIDYKIDKQLLLFLTFGFIAATVIGTVTHECGHYLAAKSVGYDAAINYGATRIVNSANKIITSDRDAFLFTLGGPLQTILTGTIGFILLFLFRKSYQSAQRLSFGQWTLIFISLFWLRQTANFVAGNILYLVRVEFTGRSDEIKLSRWLHLPDYSISSVTALIGALVLAAVLFEFIPTAQRFTFILSGIIGGTLGYFLWLEWFGKIIMP